MKKNDTMYVDKTYRLLGATAPLSYMIPTRNSRSFPLLWWDEEKGINRPLRYSRNQNSPFEDEQDGNVIVEPVIFEDGLLTVPRTNQVLQKFLHYHPLNGRSFEEINLEKDATDQMQSLNTEVDALIEARSLSLEELENVCRVVFGRSTDTMTSAEMKRDVLMLAKNDPVSFLNVLKDPELRYNSSIQQFFDQGYLTTRRNEKEVWFSTPNNKKKMLTVPFGVGATTAAASFLKSDDGIEALKMLESLVEE